MNNRINFIGKASHLSPRNTQNGECLRVVNLRKSNGSLISVKGHPIELVLADADRILLYVHTCNDRKHYISQKGKTLYHESDVSVLTGSVERINKEILTLNEDLSSITSIGTTLVITTTSTIYYILHQESGYKVLGNKPPIPTIRFNDKYIEKEAIYVDAATFNGKMMSTNHELLNDFTNIFMGTFYKLRDRAYENYHFIQPYIVRYALRLYDGSHTLPSPPVLLGYSGYNDLVSTHSAHFSYDSSTDTSTMRMFSMTLNAYGLEYTIDRCQLSDWRDIVTGIDIFVSKEINLTEDRCIDYGSFENITDNDVVYRFKMPLTNPLSIEKAARDESLFYKLYSIELESIQERTTVEIKHDIRPDNIIYQPLLKVDASGFYSIGAIKSYVYNGRLHLADITRRYYEGYPLNLFTHTQDTGSVNAIAYIRTTINQPDGSCKNVLSYTSIPYFDYKLSALLSYPDSNATAMEIGIRHNGYEYYKKFPLKSVDNENRATYVNPLLEPIDVYGWERTLITTGNLEDFPTRSENFTYRTRNEMIVSELNNPFFFPSELSFNISKGIIVGMASTTIALSQGQYGEFPLYVFTSEGIWCMQQGEGDVCYARCTLIDNASIDTDTSIITTEKNIIYRSGDNLLSLNGSESTVLLPLSELKQENFEIYLRNFIGDMGIAHTDNSSLSDFFDTPISIGYLHRNNELIFFNPLFKYTLVLHLPTQHIYRSDIPTRGIVQDNNSLWVQSNNNAIYDLNREIDATTVVSLITHPIQLVPDTYTRLQQILLRMSCSHCNITIKILASHEPDGIYSNINTVKYEGRIAGHLPLKILAPGYKYYRIIVAGDVAHDFILDCADIMYEPTENNKLR